SADTAMEDGEAEDATNPDDEAMMAMMGLNGFGTTKGRHVEGNQEGSVNIKKMRTWRQYMNRCVLYIFNVHVSHITFKQSRRIQQVNRYLPRQGSYAKVFILQASRQN
ncbi:hypothetical protein SERLA73DRAFT_60068, partial [Serpula lacrymans var. lacrymans S7.3]